MKRSEDSIPVLNDIVRSGDKAIIQSSRTRRRKVSLEKNQRRYDSNAATLITSANQLRNKTKEEIIDSIIAKHILALKEELRSVIK